MEVIGRCHGDGDGLELDLKELVLAFVGKTGPDSA